MPVNTDTLNKNLYDVLSSRGYDPVSLDSKGDPTDEIEKADVFRFTYKNEGGEKGGQGWATNENNELVLYIDDNFTKSPDFESFTRFMKRWAQKRLLGFKITNKDRLLGDMKKRTVMKQKEEQLNEGYHALGKQKSYSDSIPTVKLILQHTRQLEEGEQRFRNIAKIFVENASGERFLLPTNRPGLARVFARHIAEGGTPYDDKGQHITSLIEDYSKMAGFVRATRKGQFNESALRLVNEGLMHYNNLRMTLQGLTSHRGYNKYFEDYIPVLNEETDDDVSLNELFVEETLDPRIESVMPILKRLSRNINEMNEVKELDEWAQSITEVEDETTKTLAEPADEMLDEAPGAETLKHNQNTEKSNLAAFDLAEKFDPQQKSELADLIDQYESSTDPEADYYYDGDVPDSDEILNTIRQKFGDKIADTLDKGTHKMHYGRDDKDFGYDPLADRKGPRVTKTGKANKQDIQALKNTMKDKFLFRDKVLKPNLPEEDVEEGVVDTLKKVGKKVADYIAPSDEQLLKDLQKRMGIPKHAQHGKPGMAKPNEGVEEDLDANQKRVGQLGPTEKVAKNSGARGKLVGNESREFDDIKRLAGLK